MLCCFLSAVCFITYGQKDTADNYVVRFVSIPAFNITLVPDSSLYSNKNLRKNSPFMLMFFSPDCDHCQVQIKELLTVKEELKNVQILMISALPFKYAKEFYYTYGLNKITNIKLGNDRDHNLNSIFKIKTFPSLYLYDKNGSLLKAFVGNVKMPSILDALK